MELKFEEFELTLEEATTLSIILELESMSDCENFGSEEEFAKYICTIESILIKLQKTYNV